MINFISKTPDYPEGKHRSESQYTDGSAYFINGPRVHEYLQEMNEKVFQNYQIVTIGECPGRIVFFLQFYLNLVYLRCSFT